MKKKNNRVGLYLGSDRVSAAVTQAGKIVSFSSFELSSLAEGKDKSLSEDTRWEALINKTLREVGAEGEDVYVSLIDKDFIFRLLEMPLMKKKEIESSLIYEIDKYIPFKIGELEWAYSYVSFLKEKKANISFLGIHKNNLKKTQEMFSHLNVNVAAIEPACLSLVRVIKNFKDLSKITNFVLLDFTESESYLTFFQYDLPVFNRYITITFKEGSVDIAQFVKSVNLSFQYFTREFKSYKMDKIIVVGDGVSGNAELVSSLEESLQIETLALLSDDLAGIADVEVGSIKALGVTARGYYKYKFEPVLLSTEEIIEGVKTAKAAPPLNIKLLSLIVFLGFISFVWINYSLKKVFLSEKSKMQELINSTQFPEGFKSISGKDRETIINEQNKSNKLLKKETERFFRFSPFLEKLVEEGVLPEGMWFSNLKLVAHQKYTAELQGYVFLENNYEEREALNSFISNLKQDEKINAMFSSIEIVSLERIERNGFMGTSFFVKLIQ